MPDHRDAVTSGEAPGSGSKPGDLARAAMQAAARTAKANPGGRSRRVAGRRQQNWSAPGPDPKDPQPLGSLVGRLVDDRGWGIRPAKARCSADGRNWSDRRSPHTAGRSNCARANYWFSRTPPPGPPSCGCSCPRCRPGWRPNWAATWFAGFGCRDRSLRAGTPVRDGSRAGACATPSASRGRFPADTSTSMIVSAGGAVRPHLWRSRS